MILNPREVEQALVCLRRGTVGGAVAAGAEIPDEIPDELPGLSGSRARAHLIGVLCFRRNASTAAIVSGRRFAMPSYGRPRAGGSSGYFCLRIM